jgi:hypothetical protein
MSLQVGLDALKQERFQEAVEILEAFCLNSSDRASSDYLKAQMGLVKAYHRTGELDSCDRFESKVGAK